MPNMVAGTMSQSVITKLSLPYSAGDLIFIGPSNIAHMQSSHPADYTKYGKDIAGIISSPDYIGINKSDSSIEYVKEYPIANEYVKVAVRESSQGVLFVRSVYVLKTARVLNFIEAGTLTSYS